jgi:hypothetical protein
MALTIATPPKIKPRLKMFEPITLLTEIFSLPSNAAMMVTANSGADVPMATMVYPITSSDKPTRRAIRAAELTIQVLPIQRPAIAAIATNQFNNMSISLFLT